MAPPGLLATPASGGSATPTKNELIAAARLILDNCGITFSNSKIYRLVIGFKARCPYADGYLFFQYLTNAVQMSEAQQRAALLNPDIARVIAYADPTGETAVNNVIRGGNRRG